jgi:hypothetical protein
MRRFRAVVPVLVLMVISSMAKADDSEFDAALKYLAEQGGKSQKTLAKAWKSATGFVPWKNADGERIATARFVSADDTSVTLEKKSGKQVTVELDKLDFGGKGRVKRILEMKDKIVPAAAKLRVRREAEEKERLVKEAAEEKHRQWLAAMTPAERKVRELAKQKSEAGLAKEQAKDKEVATANPQVRDSERKEIQRQVANTRKLFKTLGAHLAAGTLTADAVNNALRQADTPAKAAEWMDMLTFEEDNPEFAYILLDEDKLITRIDAYHEALAKLTPGERKAIGFQAKFFDRYEKKYGQRRMWDFYLEQAKAGKEPVLGKRAEE